MGKLRPAPELSSAIIISVFDYRYMPFDLSRMLSTSEFIVANKIAVAYAARERAEKLANMRNARRFNNGIEMHPTATNNPIIHRIIMNRPLLPTSWIPIWIAHTCN